MGRALALVVGAGIALRFGTLGLQSLWYDEAVTAELLRMDLPGMLEAIPDSESTPPLYYVLGWLWTQLAGTGEAGLRSLSALAGSATIPVVWALGRRLGGDRAALAAAALAAVNPMLVWFSQEARAYALLALLGALSALLWLRALDAPRGGRLLAWGVVAALALATHYFALFLVAPQALWLLVRLPDRRARAAALAPVLLAGAALAPLALHQRANDSAAFIGDSSLLARFAQVPKQFLVGYDAPQETLLALATALALLVGIAGAVRLLRSTGAGAPPDAARRDGRRLAAVAAAALALPALGAAVDEDHVITRNVIAVLPLLAALAGAGLAAVAAAGGAARRVAAGAAAAACLLALVAVIGVARDDASQRDDWRGAVAALGAAPGERLISATPGSALVPLRYYLPSARHINADAATTAEIDYLAVPARSPGERPAPPRPAQNPSPSPLFAVTARVEGESFTVIRLAAPAPQVVPVAAVQGGLDGRPAAVLVAIRPAAEQK